MTNYFAAKKIDNQNSGIFSGSHVTSFSQSLSLLRSIYRHRQVLSGR